MQIPDRMVLVVARQRADLEKLASHGGSKMLPCGGIGRMIAERVLNGGGRALVIADEIRTAIDTTDGQHALLDNFDILDCRTGEPLMHLLMKSLMTNAKK